MIYFRKSNFEEAEKKFNEVITNITGGEGSNDNKKAITKPDEKQLYRDCLRLRACCYKEKSEGGENQKFVDYCLEDCNTLLQIGGENPDVETLDLLGRLQFELGKFNESEE